MARNIYSRVTNKRLPTRTPQTQPIPGKEKLMAKNNAGGYSFKLDPWKHVERFLILGSEGGTYYVGEHKLTTQNVDNLRSAIKSDCKRLVNLIVDISDAGRAPKNDPALFALALCATEGDAEGRKYALAALPKVARIGTHLFHFASYMDGMRGWGRGVRTAVGKWYTSRSIESLSFQLAKYQNRDGWSNADILRLSHPKPLSDSQSTLFQWACGKWNGDNKLLGLVEGLELMKKAKSDADVIDLIVRYRMPLETIPNEYRTSLVWRAALPNLGYTAVLRNLGNMTKAGLLEDREARNYVMNLLADEAKIKKGRVHPLAIAVAMDTYQQGHGIRGGNQWTPVQPIIDALEDAQLKSFGLIEPTGKSIMYALDVSGSMYSSYIANTQINCATGTAILSLAMAKSEKDYAIFGFDTVFKDLGITKSDSFKDAVRKVRTGSFGGTDCALPMIWALERRINFDAFVILTDSETWAGRSHPYEAIEKYRRMVNPTAKLIVVGMTATGFSINNPEDMQGLDVVGFDTATPNIISDFIRGEYTNKAADENEAD